MFVLLSSSCLVPASDRVTGSCFDTDRERRQRAKHSAFSKPHVVAYHRQRAHWDGR